MPGFTGSHSWVRTGDLGFLWPDIRAGGASLAPYLYILGSMSDTLDIRIPKGLAPVSSAHTLHEAHGSSSPTWTYFCQDIEATAEASHPNMAPDGCVLFKEDEEEDITSSSSSNSNPGSYQALILVCQLKSMTSEADALAVIPSLIASILHIHQLPLDLLLFVPEGALLRSRMGEKQRGSIREAYRANRIRAAYQFRIGMPKRAPQPMRGLGTGGASGGGLGAGSGGNMGGGAKWGRPASFFDN